MDLNYIKFYNQAVDAFKNGEDDLTIDCLRLCIKLHPVLAAPYRLKAMCHGRQNQYVDAIENITKAIYIEPESNDYFFLGDFYRHLNDYEQAIPHYLNYVNQNSSDSRGYCYLAACFYHIGDYEMCIEFSVKSIALAPGWSYPCSCCCQALMDTNRYSEAIELFEMGINNGFSFNNDESDFLLSSPNTKFGFDDEFKYKVLWDKIYFPLGYCYLNLGDTYSAKRYFKRAVQINPLYQRAWEELGNCYKLEGQNKIAKKYYLHAQTINPDTPLSYYFLYKLPQSAFNSDEISGLPYFYKALTEFDFETIDPILFKRLFPAIIDDCLSIDAPLILLRFIGRDASNMPFDSIINPHFQEIYHISRQCIQQFTIWEKDRTSPQSSFITEAIINYYMGDPIRAYEIFDNYIDDTIYEPMPIIAQYYFALSAQATLKDHQKCLESFAYPQAINVMNDPNSQNYEKYYAALIMSLTGNTEKALNQLNDLIEQNYIAANYASAQLKNEHLTDETAISDVSKTLSVWHNFKDSYFNNPTIIVLPKNEELMLGTLTPLIHLMENKEIVEHLSSTRVNYKTEKEVIFDQHFFFAKHFYFSDKDEDILENLKDRCPNTYAEIYGSDESYEIIISQIQLFKAKEKYNTGAGIDYFANMLHSEAFRDYSYIKDNINNAPPKTQFLHFISLVAALHKESLITIDEAMIFQTYIRYCAERVASISTNYEFVNILVGEVINRVVTISVLTLSYSTIQALCLATLHKMKGVKSKLMSFAEFKELLQN